MNEFTPSEHDIHTLEPESMSVGKLNNVVRALREELYQARLRGSNLYGAAQEVLDSRRAAKEAIQSLVDICHSEATK